MRKDEKDTTFRFGIVEENGKDVTIEITEEDYQRQLAAGVPKDELLTVGLHKARRGGFLERHPNLKLKDVNIQVIKSKKDEQFSSVSDNEKKAA